MINLIYSFLVGLAVWAILFVPGLLRLGEAVVPGVLGLVITYFLLARRTFKKVENIFNEAVAAMSSMPPKFDLAIKTMEKAYAFNRQQIGVHSQVDAQIGVTLFLQQEFTKALPYLERSKGFGHWLAAAMLAVVYYKKKNQEDMKKTLELVTSRAKKQSLAWCLRAYLLSQIGEQEAAMRVLAEGVKKTKNDAKVEEALLAVQNNRKIKMKAFKEQWYQFHLEKPPVEYQQMAMGGGKITKSMRRGRW